MKRNTFLASVVALALLALMPFREANAQAGAMPGSGSKPRPKVVTTTTYT